MGAALGLACGDACSRMQCRGNCLRTGPAVKETPPNSATNGEGTNPLPDGWQAFKNSKNEIYFINTNTKEHTKADPRPLPSNWTEQIKENGKELERWFINSELIDIFELIYILH